MGRRPARAFAATFAIAAGVGLAAWLAADVLMNLDESFGISDAGGDPLIFAAGRYAATFRRWGPPWLGTIAAGSAAVAGLRARRAARARPDL